MGVQLLLYILDQKPVLLYWEGRPHLPSVQLWEGCTWNREGRRGHLPSQPDSPHFLNLSLKY